MEEAMSILLRAVAATLVASGVFLQDVALGQGYPTKPVRIITGGPGSFADIASRHLTHRLTELWNRPVVVENRAGAGLTIGTAIAAKAPPDGYTLLMSDRTAISSAPSLYQNLAYDPVKDLSPVTLVATTPLVLVALPSVPASNLREFIAYTKQLSQGLTHGTGGPGTVNHLAGELMKQLTGAELVPVHYKGTGAAMVAILGGEVKAGFSMPPIALPHLKAGKIRAYVITSRNRFAGAPDIPTVTEAGVPHLESEYWVGLLVPARTPPVIVEKLNGDFVAILKSPAMQAVLLDQGAVPAPGAPEQFAAFIDSETRKWGQVIKTAGIKPE
jgi:tripartite-type tricarboxylate transporter receptor subunit TctC